jgi:hypothetical protein
MTAKPLCRTVIFEIDGDLFAVGCNNCHMSEVRRGESDAAYWVKVHLGFEGKYQQSEPWPMYRWQNFIDSQTEGQ